MTSGRDDASAKNYVCVDQSPQGNVGGHKYEGGAVLMPVSVACGVMPCPKYENSKGITCVVCSK